MNDTANGKILIPRRKFLTLAAGGGIGAATGIWAAKRNFASAAPPTSVSENLYVPGRFAEKLLATPAMAEGPFYPERFPLDTDNDLLILNDSITPAVGAITHLSGRVLTTSGDPVVNAFVEIWQVDNQGAYLHKDSANGEKRDSNFQGYGRFLTNRKGEYYFRTIKPVSYPGRVPHIHFAVSINGHRVLTTQMLTRGFAGNEQDGLFRRIKDVKSREALTAQYKPVAGSTIGELAAEFDLVLGVTPDENEPVQSGVAKPTRR